MDETARAQIRDLLGTGLSTEEVARTLDFARGTVSAVKAHMTMGSYQGSSAGFSDADVEEIDNAANLKFGLERDMQEALRRNIQQLDPTLRIEDEGKEQRVEGGRVDILAADDQGRVVVELKAGAAPESAITQVLSYIGSLQSDDDPRPVRGMLIAGDFSPRVKLAARAAGIQLVEYGFRFSFAVVD
jgi:RecB family endonuclease NucS